MIQPDGRFSADQLRFLQNEGSAWVQHIEKQIIDAAEAGKTQVYIDCTDKSDPDKKYRKSGVAILEHFKRRGFSAEYTSSTTGFLIKW